MTWRMVSTVFTGGSAEAKALFGKRVRVKNAQSIPEFLLDNYGPTVNLYKGQEGFVGFVPNDKPELVTLAFPKIGVAAPSIEALMKKPMIAVRVNWPTFKAQYEIDI
jgi:hypothetical protein